MKIRIDIDCETVTEFHAHLLELAKQVRSEAKRLKLDPRKEEFPETDDLNPTVELNDASCYGSHEVTIKKDLY